MKGFGPVLIVFAMVAALVLVVGVVIGLLFRLLLLSVDLGICLLIGMAAGIGIIDFTARMMNSLADEVEAEAAEAEDVDDKSHEPRAIIITPADFMKLNRRQGQSRRKRKE